MAERINLAIVRDRSYWPEGWELPLQIRRAQPLWRARRGYKIHRPHHGRIYLHNRHMSLTWYCGNCTNEPIPVTPECMDGLEPCVICEAKYREATDV